MELSKIIKSYIDRYPFIGPVAWLISVQYFAVQIIVALAWTTPYSFLKNPISDLGNTSCGFYSGRSSGNAYICSPLHDLMNISFVVLGLLMALGSMFVYQEFKKSHLTFIGFYSVALGGIGTIIVGLFPENTISFLHAIGAALPFLVGNLGIVILGFSLRLPKWAKIYTLITGFTALTFLLFYFFKIYLGIGVGGVERLTAYPQTIWLIVMGIFLLVDRPTKTN